MAKVQSSLFLHGQAGAERDGVSPRLKISFHAHGEQMVRMQAFRQFLPNIRSGYWSHLGLCLSNPLCGAEDFLERATVKAKKEYKPQLGQASGIGFGRVHVGCFSHDS